MRLTQSTTLLVTALALLGTTSAFAQDNNTTPTAKKAQRCVSLIRVDHTDVIDDQTIVFHMLDRSILVNHLDHKCPGLKVQDRFMYKPVNNRLCSVGTITVLHDSVFGFQPGFTCALGEFQPITKDQLAALKHEADNKADMKVKKVKPKKDKGDK